MKYDMKALPKGSLQRIVKQLDNDDLTKALATWKQGSVDLADFVPHLNACLQRLQKSGKYTVLLAALHKFGAFAPLSIRDILLDAYERRDYATFVKYTHRLSFYQGLEGKVRRALEVEDKRGNRNVPRWTRRFEKTLEQYRIAQATGILRVVEVAIEPEADEPIAATKRLVLRPLGPRALRTPDVVTRQRDQEPYLLLQVSKAKVERANTLHAEVVRLLASNLRALGLEPRENRLVDTYCECGGNISLFEVKSLNDRNERDQIRQAISQLYEYRFLFDISSASLWVALSSRPTSGWMVEYLVQDRGISVLWVENGELAGPSITEFRRLSGRS